MMYPELESTGPYPAKVAVLDLGSNSVKLVCYSADHTGTYRPYRRESSRIRLDENNDRTIQKGPADRLIDHLTILHNVILYEDIDRVLPVATSAVREADNSAPLLARIRREVGFDFDILTGYQEALYSYAGAASYLDMSSCVFFDLGGGSLEIASSRNHTIMHALSLPLGALVTTRQFVGHGGFDHRSTTLLREYIRKRLPPKSDLGRLDQNTILVGVGGTLRAIARYEQEQTGYPLKKTHNYIMSRSSVQDIASHILSCDTDTLGAMYEIGRGRADIIQAGAIIVLELMKWYGFEAIVVSGSGLREGVLELALRYPGFRPNDASEYHVRELVRAPTGTSRMPWTVAGMIEPLKQSGLLYDDEPTVLQAAVADLTQLRLFCNADGFLYMMMEQPIPLSHRIQLLAVLCLIHSKRPKRAALLMRRYASILHTDDWRIVRRLSVIVKLCELVVIAGAKIQMIVSDEFLNLLIQYRSRAVPASALYPICEKMESKLGRKVTVQTKHQPQINLRTASRFQRE